MNLGKAMKDIRRKKGIKKTQIERETGIAYETISALEENRKGTRITTLIVLADMYGVKVSDIFLEAEKYE